MAQAKRTARKPAPKVNPKTGGKVLLRPSPDPALEHIINGFDAEKFLTTVGIGKTEHTFKSKAPILRQGQPSSAVYYLEKGSVQLSVVSQQGKEAVVAILGPGDFFGEGCLAGQPLLLSSATALTTSTVMRVDKEAMVRVLHDHRHMAEIFTAYLLSRNARVEADLIDQLFNSSERRLARLLLLLSNFGKDGKMETVLPMISQELLAARIGTTRGRINHFMNKFRKLGFIEYNGELKVHTSLLRVVVQAD